MGQFSTLCLLAGSPPLRLHLVTFTWVEKHMAKKYMSRTNMKRKYMNRMNRTHTKI